MKIPTLVIAGAFVICGLTGGVALAGKDVALEKVPPRVRTSIQKEVGKGTIEDIEMETKNGVTVYEIEFELDDVEYDLDIDANGKVLKKEKDD
ncbi:MAG TPA: PepSY domain-containing protein [Kofleriaceae bacterium]|nr:PepSY domain-containing protein [Kofleriaceae bacterium]